MANTLPAYPNWIYFFIGIGTIFMSCVLPLNFATLNHRSPGQRRAGPASCFSVTKSPCRDIIIYHHGSLIIETPINRTSSVLAWSTAFPHPCSYWHYILPRSFVMAGIARQDSHQLWASSNRQSRHKQAMAFLSNLSYPRRRKNNSHKRSLTKKRNWRACEWIVTNHVWKDIYSIFHPISVFL